MAKVPFTPHQQEAVEVLGGNILVSAAAGSGKTAVLTERVVRLLTGECPISADRIIVVTFTVAAADEMRRRISARIGELIEENPTDEWLQSQQLLLSGAKISTIHKLCNGLIKEHQQELGLSGDLKIMEETDLAVLKQEAVDEVFEECYGAGEETFTELVEFTCTKNDRPLVELVLSVYDFIRSFAFPLEFLERAEAMYEQADGLKENHWIAGVSGHVAAALSHAVGILQGCVRDLETDVTVQEKYGESFRSDLEQLTHVRDTLLSGAVGEAAELAAKLQKLPLKAVRKYEYPEFLESLKNRRKRAYEIADGVFSRYLCFSDVDFREDMAVLLPKIHVLFDTVRRVYQRIEEKKREQESMDYADLEHFALKLLVEKTPEGFVKTEAAQALSESFDQIMIDECQDINEVQNLIFRLLSRDGTNLFMVGDVKQSIYRFRKAMPKLFIEKKNRFSPYNPETHALESEETIVLENNFRSREEVCDVVNYLFTQIMSSEMGEIEYGEGEALVPGATYPEYSEAYPEVHILDYDRDNDEEKNVVEARYLAGLIGRMVREGYQVRDGSGMRACTYRDFAILLRSFSGKAPVYASELKSRGVPCFSESSEGYFDAYEVMVILNLLRVVDNPLLDVPLLSVLMSPMFAFSPDKVAEIRLAGASRKSAFYLALCALAEKGDASCRDFVAFLSELRQKAALMPADALIQEIYDQTDFIALAYAMGGGEQKDANLRLLLSYAEKYGQVGAGGLSGFLRYLERIIEGGHDFRCANTISAKSDCVQILSIHASKGLEFPICIVADCGKKFNKSDLNSKFQLNSELGFSLKISDPATLRSYTSLPFEAIRLQSEKESISEEMRVLYVAMTRAKEKLILAITLPNAESRLRSIADSISGEGEGYSPFEVFSAQGYEGWVLSAMLRHPDFAEIRMQIGREDIPLLREVQGRQFHVRGVLTEGATEPTEEDSAERMFREEALPVLCERLEKGIYFPYHYAPLTEVPAKLTVTQIAKQARAEQITLEARPAFLERQGLTPAQRGTILHSFMQYADFAAAEVDLHGEVNRMRERGFLTPEETEALNLPKIRAFLCSPLYGRMKSAQEVLREYKFLYFLRAVEVEPSLTGDFAEERILIQGIADCLLFEQDGITIIDYKTDYAESGAVLAERYFDQLRIYKDAIGQAFSRPVKQCLLYSLHLEQEIEIFCGTGRNP